MSDILLRLEAVIAARKAAGDTEGSHVARLLAKGSSKCAEKFGEEAVEAVIAAAERDRGALVSESADVLFHMLVMLAAQDVSLKDVLAELERREGVSGVAEKKIGSGCAQQNGVVVASGGMSHGVAAGNRKEMEGAIRILQALMRAARSR